MAKDIFKTDFCKITKFSCTCGRTYINTSNCKQCTCGNEKQTNADRIRSMSDEELAEFICTHEVCKWDSASYDIPGIVEWLQSEAE